MSLVDSVRLAVGTLTIVPTGRIRQLDRRTAGTAMTIAPVAVIPLALVASGIGRLGHLAGFPALTCGLLVVGALALGTRALHLDGLADTVDGLGSGWDRDKAMTVMRRGDVGPMGVTALILMLAAQVVASGALSSSWRGAVLLAVLVCASRAGLALVCRTGVPAARTDGLGAAVAGSVSNGVALVSWLLIAALLAALSGWTGQSWWLGPVWALVTVLLVLLLVRTCVRRFGGVTGDVMGAGVEVGFTALVVLAAR